MTLSIVVGVAAFVALLVALFAIIRESRKRRNFAERFSAVDERRAEQIGRLVAAQRGPAETAAERLRQDLHRR